MCCIGRDFDEETMMNLWLQFILQEELRLNGIETVIM